MEVKSKANPRLVGVKRKEEETERRKKLMGRGVAMAAAVLKRYSGSGVIPHPRKSEELLNSIHESKYLERRKKLVVAECLKGSSSPKGKRLKCSNTFW